MNCFETFPECSLPNTATKNTIKMTCYQTRVTTFARIISAHPYCARKFECHAMHRARALSTKMNNDRADGHNARALTGFNDLGRSVTPTFLFRNRFILHLSPLCPKMNEN